MNRGMRIRLIILCCASIGLVTAAEPLPATPNPFDDLNLETHGFASFGYLRSWQGVTYGDSEHGTTDFWEAGINVIARPIDHLRLGAQLFARDLGDFDNGKPQLDWAYADWRANDAFGIQIGRVRPPVGLFNEIQDIDAARTPVFLPVSVYNPRMRDLFISTDGGKVYGLLPLGGSGELEYQFFAGSKRSDPDLGFASFFVSQGLGTQVDAITIQPLVGGMLHWSTPIEGLAVRATVTDAHDFEVKASTPAYGLKTRLSVDDYYMGVASLLYECGDWTIATEYARWVGVGRITVEPLGLIQDYKDHSDAGYLSATWHQRPWLEWYAAIEGSWSAISDRQDDYTKAGVFAASLMPLSNWSLKAEWRESRYSGQEMVRSLALKTTVDF
jgi:hypothetical protein